MQAILDLERFDVNARDGDDRTLLMYAVLRGAPKEALYILLEEDVDPRLPLASGNSLLHLAVYNRQYHLIEPLLLLTGQDRSALIDVNQRNRSRYTALMAAIKKGAPLGVIRSLAEAPGANVNVRMPDKGSLLYLAIYHKQYALLDYLLSLRQQGKPALDINHVNVDGYSALMLAVMIDAPIDVIHRLLLAGADPLYIGYELFVEQFNPDVVYAVLEKIEASTLVKMLLVEEEGFKLIERLFRNYHAPEELSFLRHLLMVKLNALQREAIFSAVGADGKPIGELNYYGAILAAGRGSLIKRQKTGDEADTDPDHLLSGERIASAGVMRTDFSGTSSLRASSDVAASSSVSASSNIIASAYMQPARPLISRESLFQPARTVAQLLEESTDLKRKR